MSSAAGHSGDLGTRAGNSHPLYYHSRASLRTCSSKIVSHHWEIWQSQKWRKEMAKLKDTDKKKKKKERGEWVSCLFQIFISPVALPWDIRCTRPLLVTLVEMTPPSCKTAPALRFKRGLAHSLNGPGVFPSPQGQQDKKYACFYYQLCDNKIASSRRHSRSSTHLMFRDWLEFNHLYKTTKSSWGCLTAGMHDFGNICVSS